MLLSRWRGPWYCYRHLARQRGRKEYEDHHVLARRRDPTSTVRVPADVHRLLEEMKRRWPRGVEQNPTGDPLLDAAGLELSAADVAHQFDRQHRRSAGWLLQLRAALADRFGPTWWLELGVDPPPGEADDDPTTT
ncbi:MAG: hypothetical protein SFV24_16955 [Gemmatimonadales bacterium]|nr:hypothetical protein [Gemmatimonadales bacterium]